MNLYTVKIVDIHNNRVYSGAAHANSMHDAVKAFRGQVQTRIGMSEEAVWERLKAVDVKQITESGCNACGTPTFGPLCARCKGELPPR